MKTFAASLLDWYRTQGRHDLPWKQQVSAYGVWVSEIMLQQTQVSTVLPYYARFMQTFPDVKTLARAELDAVLSHWAGLGYYARARNLHQAARQICRDFAGEFPDNIHALMSLPGVGRSTAGAILCLGFNQAQPILDGNVKRVLCRYHALAGWPGERRVEKRLWALAEGHVATAQAGQAAAYTQAIMDLGALVCTRARPHCARCPLRRSCAAFRQGLTHELPHTRPQKKLPVKQAIFALIENQAGEILLQKRAPAGIWGGLWSLPECPHEQDVPAWLRTHYGLTTAIVARPSKLRHTFSHFHLEIQPVRLKLAGENMQVHEGNEIYWHKPGREIKLGMAAPVKRLIKDLGL